MDTDKNLIKQISEAFAKGNIEFAEKYFADNIRWNIIGEATIKGKEQVLEIYQMSQLESFPVVTIKNMLRKAIMLLCKVQARQELKAGSLITKLIAIFLDLKITCCRK